MEEVKHFKNHSPISLLLTFGKSVVNIFWLNSFDFKILYTFLSLDNFLLDIKTKEYNTVFSNKIFYNVGNEHL